VLFTILFVIPAKAGIQLHRNPMREEKQPAVYMLASSPRGTIYIGVTSALWNRITTHKDGGVAGFTSKYDVSNLVWYEHHDTMESAIKREKQIKKWNRDWKIRMIEELNPHWLDLHDSIDLDRRYVDPKLDSRLRGNDERI
jgi:putative endonuclease